MSDIPAGVKVESVFLIEARYTPEAAERRPAVRAEHAPVVRVAQKEVPLPYNARLEQLALPQVDDIINAVQEVLR